MRDRVVAARDRQMARDGVLNARLQGRELRARTALDADARRMFDAALTRLALTARGHDRVLRVARTIADLDRSDAIGAEHLGEALQFRGSEVLVSLGLQLKSRAGFRPARAKRYATASRTRDDQEAARTAAAQRARSSGVRDTIVAATSALP